MDDIEAVRGQFAGMRPGYEMIAARFVGDPGDVVDEAAALYDRMVPDLAYLDAPDHPMADSLFKCAMTLAVYLALKDRGVDVHDFGATVVEMFAMVPAPPDQFGDDSALLALKSAAEASQREPRKGEFVFEVLEGVQDADVAMNVKSCGICHHFSKYGAIELVPYMCALDDVISDKLDHGLRRTGTIALGAQHCDFRFRRGGDPLRVADTHPEQIRLKNRGGSAPSV